MLFTKNPETVDDALPYLATLEIGEYAEQEYFGLEVGDSFAFPVASDGREAVSDTAAITNIDGKVEIAARRLIRTSEGWKRIE